MSKAIEDIAAERARQVSQEGWTPEHDDKHGNGQMAEAAACYILGDDNSLFDFPCIWPWHKSWWKPTNRRRNLVKAGALIAAEIERLDRLTANQS